jgi:hypothetical protein
MTSEEILARAAGLIDRSGLARKMAYDKTTNAYCLGAALVEAATYNKRFHEREYTTARNLLCGHMGVSSSYDGLVDFNDDSFVTKKGELRYKHSPTDILKEIRETIALAKNPTPS